MTMNNRLAALAFGLAVAAVASPSVAQRNSNYENEVGPARAAALRECNGQAQKYVDYNWGVQQDEIYSACMAKHGQTD